MKPLRCKYRRCRRVMHVTWASYVENPYCTACLPERMQLAAARDPVVALRRDGNYLTPIRRSDMERKKTGAQSEEELNVSGFEKVPEGTEKKK